MKLIGITYRGPEMDDIGTFNALPSDLKVFIKEANGLIAFKGGLHIRGCCKEPLWHSINEVWTGKSAFWKNYPDILDIDVPFAQDCMGDQFLIRGSKVIKLNCENGEVTELQMQLWNFFEEIEKDPILFLGMHPLIQFEMEGGKLEPGNLLSAYPPFCINQTGEVTLKEMPVLERLNSLSLLSKKMRGMQDGDDVQFIVD
ncbi:MAG TPA: hypothetical protein VD908_10635 [Cytophagales bacterium]|nr:hypothetical protein [Cytophagales bacterium]